MDIAPKISEELRAILDEVPDPEVPVISVVELGVVREAERVGSGARVVVTPTYSGCPAMHVIEEDIRAALEAHGISPVEISTAYAPAWTTEWMNDAARAKLKAYGIAPPGPAEAAGGGLVQILSRREATVTCPWCDSRNTERRSEFGSTACKAIHFCNSCQQPFEEFKAI